MSEKDNESFEHEVEENGKTVTRSFSITETTLQQQNEATKVYNRAFRDALESGALLRNKLEDYMRNQNLWNDEKQDKLEGLQKEILDGEKRLSKGGIRLSAAKDIAMEMSERRTEIRVMLMEKNSLDGSTAEGQADNARFDYLVSSTLVYNDSNKPFFNNLADYRNRNTETVSVEAARRIAQRMYGLDADHDHKLAENKFLKEFSFIDEELRLVNDEGKLVDREGTLINEDGRYVDKKGNLIDKDGNPVTEEGEYDFKRKPFLDEDGKEVKAKAEVKAEAEKEPEAEEEPEAEVKVEAETEEEESEAKDKD
jgi:hypothetical protein